MDASFLMINALATKRFVAHTLPRNLCEFVMQFISRNVAGMQQQQQCKVYRVAIYCGAELSMQANKLASTGSE